MAKNANKEVSNGKGVCLVADVDITNEPLPVQTLCWELLDLIQSAEDWDIEFSDWTKKAEKLPFPQEKVVRKFAKTLRKVPIDKAEIGSRWRDHTEARPVSGAIH